MSEAEPPSAPLSHLVLTRVGRHALADRQRLLSLAIFPGLVAIGAVLDMDIFYAAVLGALLAARAAFAGDRKAARGLTARLEEQLRRAALLTPSELDNDPDEDDDGETR